MMIKNNIFVLFIFFISSLLLSNCSKGPIVTDIVKGIYDSSKIKEETKSKKIKIVTGDTLDSISKKYNVSIEKIMKINNLKDNQISIGQEIKYKD